MFLEFDQAIYNKVIQVLFAYQKKENRKFDKLGRFSCYFMFVKNNIFSF